MVEIYLVTGRSGEYSDKCWWTVRAFEREEDAKAFAVKLKAIVDSAESAYRNSAFDWDEKERLEASAKEQMAEMDPQGHWYLGEDADYSVEAIPFVGVA